MELKMHISPRIIPNIATLYTDYNRIILEYVDNSLDSAEQFYNPQKKAYNKNINIKVIFQGKTEKTGKIIVEDNCFGITNFPKLVESLGNSDKKNDFTTNGRFGFGIYSYLAACKTLKIESTLEGKGFKRKLELHSDIFNVDKQEDVAIPDVVEIPYDINYSGTSVCLSNFDKTSWKEITIDKIKNEIENHFSFMLTRKNLTIEVIKDNEKHRCEFFDYLGLSENVFTYEFNKLNYENRRRQQCITLPNPINIILVFTPDKIMKKPPVIVIKGRRIAALKEISSFKSKHKNDIWGHPHLTGYIELPDSFSPNIARTDLVQDIWTKALYYELYDLEPLILEDLQAINQKETSKHYEKLSQEITKVLSDLAKEDKINEREKKVNIKDLQDGSNGSGLSDGMGGKDTGGTRHISNPGSGIGLNDGKGAGIDNSGGDNPGSNNGGNKPLIPEFEDDNNHHQRQSGISVQIIDSKPPESPDRKDKFYRSIFDENRKICIYRFHPDFQERVTTKRDGTEIVSDRLINYLANEVTVHYKDIFYTKNGQPDYNIDLFVDMVDFVYRVEEKLKNLKGENLSDL